MSKELEALKWLEKEIEKTEFKLKKDIKLRDKLTIYQHNALENCVDRISKYESKLKKLNIIKQTLQRLEAIDNTEPSEAMECLDRMSENARVYVDLEEYNKDANTIKQALLKQQKQEKALKIIKEKNVDIGYLRNCDSEEEYNLYISNYDNNYWKRQSLTQEEFELLKEVFE